MSTSKSEAILPMMLKYIETVGAGNFLMQVWQGSDMTAVEAADFIQEAIDELKKEYGIDDTGNNHFSKAIRAGLRAS